MRKHKIIVGSLALAALFLAAGCSGDPLSTREEGTLGGAGIGAIVGATVPDKGFRVVDRGALTAIGAGLGSGAGVIVGTIVGALIRTERWQDVPLTSLTFRGDVPTFGAVASTGGVGLALPVPWLGH